MAGLVITEDSYHGQRVSISLLIDATPVHVVDWLVDWRLPAGYPLGQTTVRNHTAVSGLRHRPGFVFRGSGKTYYSNAERLSPRIAVMHVSTTITTVDGDNDVGLVMVGHEIVERAPDRSELTISFHWGGDSERAMWMEYLSTWGKDELRKSREESRPPDEIALRYKDATEETLKEEQKASRASYLDYLRALMPELWRRWPEARSNWTVTAGSDVLDATQQLEDVLVVASGHQSLAGGPTKLSSPGRRPDPPIQEATQRITLRITPQQAGVIAQELNERLEGRPFGVSPTMATKDNLLDTRIPPDANPVVITIGTRDIVWGRIRILSRPGGALMTLTISDINPTAALSWWDTLIGELQLLEAISEGTLIEPIPTNKAKARRPRLVDKELDDLPVELRIKALRTYHRLILNGEARSKRDAARKVWPEANPDSAVKKFKRWHEMWPFVLEEEKSKVSWTS